MDLQNPANRYLRRGGDLRFLKKKEVSRMGLITISTGFGHSGQKELKRMVPKYDMTIATTGKVFSA